MDKRFDFYKEQYYFELNRRNDITNSLAIPIGFLTALLAGYAYFFLHMIYVNTWLLSVFFCLFFCISVCNAIIAIFHLFNSIRGLEYGYIPEPDKLSKFEDDYLKFVAANDISIEKVDEIFFEGLKKSFVITTSRNRKNNNFRSNRILRANVLLIYAIFFFFLASIPFIISKNIYDNKFNNQNTLTVMALDEETNTDEVNNQDYCSPIPEEPIFPMNQFITESRSVNFPIQNEETDFIERIE